MGHTIKFWLLLISTGVIATIMGVLIEKGSLNVVLGVGIAALWMVAGLVYIFWPWRKSS